MTTRRTTVESLYTSFDHLNLPLGEDGTWREYFEALRDEALATDAPVGWSEAHGGFWVVTGYAEARQLLHTVPTFSSLEVSFPPYRMPDGRKLMLSEMDPPQHKKYRAIVNAPFSPRNAERVAATLRALANRLIDDFIGDGRVDICDVFTKKVPEAFAAIILGSPPGDGHRFRDWVHAMTVGHLEDPEDADRHNRALGEYFDTMYEERRQNPGDDVLSLVMASELDGERLSRQEVKDFWVLLMLASIENTSLMLNNLIWRLAWDQELRARCIAEPDSWPIMVDEFLRYLSPITAGCRLVSERVELGGVTMEAGQHAILAVPAINRDPREFEDPDAFIVDRSPNRHLSLGLGPHRCLGAHLLRVEVRVAMQEFLRRIPEFELDPDRPLLWKQGQTSGMTTVPITFAPGEPEHVG